MKFRFKDYLAPLKILQFRNQMAKQPYWSEDRQTQWSWAQRRLVVKNAYDSVPYYKELFDSQGIDPNRLGDENEWRKIPTLSKQIVRENGKQLVSETYGRGRMWANTSGSTGQRMDILLDSNINAAAFALFWRAWSSGGYWRIGQRQAGLRGARADWITRLNWKIRTLEIASNKVTAEHASVIAEAIINYRPKFLRCYPSALFLLCRYLREQGIELKIPMVVTGSETLSDFQRKEFESFLGARIFNHYTHWERAASVLECIAGRLHAQEDYGHHEILRSDGTPVAAGEVGEIVATGLHHQAMPFIRYRTGDMASWSAEKCDCGQVFPVVDKIEGRLVDYVLNDAGKALSSLGVESLLDEEEDIRCIQYIQEQPGELLLRVVANDNFEAETGLKYLTDKAEDLIGPGFRISAQLCSMDELERSPIGKLRYFINRVNG